MKAEQLDQVSIRREKEKLLYALNRIIKNSKILRLIGDQGASFFFSLALKFISNRHIVRRIALKSKSYQNTLGRVEGSRSFYLRLYSNAHIDYKSSCVLLFFFSSLFFSFILFLYLQREYKMV